PAHERNVVARRHALAADGTKRSHRTGEREPGARQPVDADVEEAPDARAENRGDRHEEGLFDTHHLITSRSFVESRAARWNLPPNPSLRFRPLRSRAATNRRARRAAEPPSSRRIPTELLGALYRPVLREIDLGEDLHDDILRAPPLRVDHELRGTTVERLADAKDRFHLIGGGRALKRRPDVPRRIAKDAIAQGLGRSGEPDDPAGGPHPSDVRLAKDHSPARRDDARLARSRELGDQGLEHAL